MKLILQILKVTLGIFVLVVLLNLSFNAFRIADLSMKSLSIVFFYCLVLVLVNAAYFTFFKKKIGWENAGLKRVILATVGSLVVTLSAYFVCRFIDFTVFREISVPVFLSQETMAPYVIVGLITTLVSLMFHLFHFYKTVQEQQVKQQKIIAGTAAAKFESLKNQLDPHFLFNSLNVLTALIEENPEHAQKFTTSLSKIYRYVLEQRDKELVNLEEELRFAQTYRKLLEMRFEDSIYFDFPTQLSSPEAKVVPLSMQLLLENCIKHNVVSDTRPLHIKIYEEDGYLCMENNLQRKEVVPNRRGVGLQNIADRYSLVTKREVLVLEEPHRFLVKVPILTKQITAMETPEMKENHAYFKAKERVKEMKEFYGNLLSYCVVIPFLIFINYMTYWEFQWFWFPLFGWGLGLAIHWFSVFGFGAGWEERKIQELMNKEQRKTWK